MTLLLVAVVPPGIEPGTQGFSVLCSTNWAMAPMSLLFKSECKGTAFFPIMQIFSYFSCIKCSCFRFLPYLFSRKSGFSAVGSTQKVHVSKHFTFIPGVLYFSTLYLYEIFLFYFSETNHTKITPNDFSFFPPVLMLVRFLRSSYLLSRFVQVEHNHKLLCIIGTNNRIKPQ